MPSQRNSRVRLGLNDGSCCGVATTGKKNTTITNIITEVNSTTTNITTEVNSITLNKTIIDGRNPNQKRK